MELGLAVRLASLHLGVGLVLILSACSGGEDQDSDDLIRAALPPNIPMEYLYANASEEQIELFRDGVIDLADYERAHFRRMQCYQDIGLEVLDWAVYQESIHHFGFKVRMPDGMFGSDLDRQRIFDCDMEHVVYVEDAWEWRNEAGEAEKQAARKAFGDCLRATGIVQVVDPPTEADITALFEQESIREEIPRCVQEAFEATGAAPF